MSINGRSDVLIRSHLDVHVSKIRKQVLSSNALRVKHLSEALRIPMPTSSYVPMSWYLPQPWHAGVFVRGIGLKFLDHLERTCWNQSSAASPSLRVTSSTVRLCRMPLRSSASWSKRLASVSRLANCV